MTKTLKSILAAAALALLAPMTALAGSSQDLQDKLASPRAFWLEVKGDSSTLMNVYYVGTGTQAVLSIDANSLDADVPYGTDATDFGTSGSIDITDAAYDTLGELCDYIEGLANYGCELIGGKRDDNSLTLRDRAGVVGDNLAGAGGFDIYQDTGPVVVGGGEPSSNYDMRLGFKPASGKRVVLKKCDVNANGATDYRVYGKSSYWEVNSRKNQRKDAVKDDTTLAWKEVIADDTGETYDWTPASAVSASDGWHFAQDAHVVVSAGNGTNVQAATNYLRCLFEER